MELIKGSLCILKRPLADFLCVVQWVDGNEVSLRHLDSPREAAYSVVSLEDVVPLGDELETTLPKNLEESINKQRQIIFSPKRAQKSLERVLQKAKGTDAMSKILQVLVEEGEVE